jgi:hypothetical protein
MKKNIFIFLCIIIIYHAFSKECVVILTGISGQKNQLKKIENFFKENYGYDAYSLDYIERKGFEETYKKLEVSLNNIKNLDYDKIHFFCYIYGGFQLLRYFEKNTMENLGNIVLDRGPIEESLAPVIRGKKLNLLLEIYGGKNLIEFSHYKYFSVPQYLYNKKIGLIIETKGTFFCLFYKNDIKKKKPDFTPGKITQKYDDYFYIDLNHKQMYDKIDLFIDEINFFFKNGNFTENVNREIKDYLSLF